MRADGIEESTMPKKDTAAAVIGMLSTAGAQTRRTSDDTERAEHAPPPSVTVTEDPPASVSTLPVPALPVTAPATEAPRTLRLLPATAQRVRQAGLEAKRDDVLLTAQDFASELVDEALARRRRSRAINRG
jgi:type IV secretory pathway VirB10-like protein